MQDRLMHRDRDIEEPRPYMGEHEQWQMFINIGNIEVAGWGQTVFDFFDLFVSTYEIVSFRI